MHDAQRNASYKFLFLSFVHYNVEETYRKNMRSTLRDKNRIEEYATKIRIYRVSEITCTLFFKHSFYLKNLKN